MYQYPLISQQYSLVFNNCIKVCLFYAEMQWESECVKYKIDINKVVDGNIYVSKYTFQTGKINKLNAVNEEV